MSDKMDDAAREAAEFLGINDDTSPSEVMAKILNSPEARAIAMDLAAGVASEPADAADDSAESPPKRGRPRKAPPADGGASRAESRPRQSQGAGGGAASGAAGVKRQTAGARVGRQLGAQIAMLGVPVALLADDYVGSIFIERGPDLGEAWGLVAEQNPRVRRVMEAMIAGGVYSQAGMATLAFVVPILAHYGLLAPRMANVFGSAPTDLHGVRPVPPPPAA